MKEYTFKENSTHILFGNGKIPYNQTVKKLLNGAKKIICIDGGADKLLKIGFEPTLIIGDLDSLDNDPKNYNCEVMKISNQSNTDLEKGLDWCQQNNIQTVALIGFTGLRDDHYLASLWSMLHYSDRIAVTIISDQYKILCLKGLSKLHVSKGQTISIITSSPDTLIKTKGLKYNLSEEKLLSPGNGMSNVASGEIIEINSDNWVWVFIKYA
tara:strand:+ start:190 stop:825 length:636 start_codon:yes stop_codon:yes gene_type:complete